MLVLHPKNLDNQENFHKNTSPKKLQDMHSIIEYSQMQLSQIKIIHSRKQERLETLVACHHPSKSDIKLRFLSPPRRSKKETRSFVNKRKRSSSNRMQLK